ncbi:MAG TPA: ABC transporter ATP-binding protein [Nitrososphaerales archaeon]|nr:ABC transporter ATP-binding protein [Nitrososphaerales archaeon]
MPAILELADFTVHYKTPKGEVRALDSVNLKVNDGEFIALVGESGCGKSTLGLATIGLLPPKSALIRGGSINYRGVDLAKLGPEAMKNYRGSEIAMIFQEPLTSLNPLRRIGEQIAEAVVLRSQRKNPGSAMKGAPRLPGRKWTFPPDLRREVEQMLTLVRIPDPDHIINRYPFELSGGMRQRAMIAMALSQQPELLIADEPTTALDVTTQAQVLKLMKEIKDRLRTTIVLVTHDLAVASQVADRVIVMYAGQIVEDAEVHEIFSSPKHPYTQGLLACIPTGNRNGKELTPIKGTIPDLTQRRDWCQFQPRCPYAMEKCSQKAPTLREVGKDHRVSCFLYGE